MSETGANLADALLAVAYGGRARRPRWGEGIWMDCSWTLDLLDETDFDAVNDWIVLQWGEPMPGAG